MTLFFPHISVLFRKLRVNRSEQRSLFLRLSRSSLWLFMDESARRHLRRSRRKEGIKPKPMQVTTAVPALYLSSVKAQPLCNQMQAHRQSSKSSSAKALGKKRKCWPEILWNINNKTSFGCISICWMACEKKKYPIRQRGLCFPKGKAVHGSLGPFLFLWLCHTQKRHLHWQIFIASVSSGENIPRCPCTYLVNSFNIFLFQ